MQISGTDSSSGHVATPVEPAVSSQAFLRRLRRMLVLRYRASHFLDDGDVRLLDHCIYATFCDCRETGAEESARRMLDEARAGQHPPV